MLRASRGKFHRGLFGAVHIVQGEFRRSMLLCINSCKSVEVRIAGNGNRGSRDTMQYSTKKGIFFKLTNKHNLRRMKMTTGAAVIPFP